MAQKKIQPRLPGKEEPAAGARKAEQSEKQSVRAQRTSTKAARTSTRVAKSH